MTNLENFLEEREAFRAEQSVRMASAYAKNRKLIKARKQSSQKLTEIAYKKWAKAKDLEVVEEIKSPSFVERLGSAIDYYRNV
tara:strand:+ start:16424 stop:16672 length:249 start_codon:yes stop_codon:yes gene_type:complete